MDSSGAPCFSYEYWNQQKPNDLSNRNSSNHNPREGGKDQNDLSNGNSSNHNLQEVGQDEQQKDSTGSNQEVGHAR